MRSFPSWMSGDFSTELRTDFTAMYPPPSTRRSRWCCGSFASLSPMADTFPHQLGSELSNAGDRSFPTNPSPRAVEPTCTLIPFATVLPLAPRMSRALLNRYAASADVPDALDERDEEERKRERCRRRALRNWEDGRLHDRRSRDGFRPRVRDDGTCTRRASRAVHRHHRRHVAGAGSCADGSDVPSACEANVANAGVPFGGSGSRSVGGPA